MPKDLRLEIAADHPRKRKVNLSLPKYHTCTVSFEPGNGSQLAGIALI